MNSLDFSPPMLRPLPGESLFSLCSRHHQFWGSATSARTTELLFGHQRRGSQHDFPSELSSFVERTEGCFGEAQDLATERTLLAYYLPFIERAEKEDAVAAICSGSVAHLKFRLGLLTSRFRANHPLKACAECMRQDVSVHGWAYWHLMHQFPGAWVCAVHGDLLRVSSLKASGVARFFWCLPDSESLNSPIAALVSDDSLMALSKLARFTLGVIQKVPSGEHLSAESMQHALRRRVAGMGWLTPGGSFRLGAMASAFIPYTRSLRGIPELEALPSDKQSAEAQLGRLLRSMRSGTHPLRWMVLASWLFESPEEFLEEAGAALTRKAVLVAEDTSTEVALGEQRLQDREQSRGRLNLLMRGGTSATAAAHEVGVSVQTAMAWAAQAGIPTTRRPKRLVVRWRELVVADLRSGLDKAAVAVKQSVSVQTVSRVLQTEVGLYAAWTSKRFENAREGTRRRWLELIDVHDGLGMKYLRSLEPAIFTWLYRNDRTWLQKHRPGRVQASLPRRSPVNWDERDLVLQARVQEAIAQLATNSKKKSLHLWEVVQIVPELKPKLRALDRLPLTRRALDQAIPQRERISASKSSMLF